jgi:ectoine hydroxylase-related dioxygenase (phytanoyl-CoA dioxygenase family)
MRSLSKIVKLGCVKSITNFQKFCFGQVNAESHYDFSQIVIQKQKYKSSFVSELQDKILSSSEFSELTNDESFKTLAASLMDVPIEDIKIVFPHFRIDLPKSFSDDEIKMSLPWHQEAGYYLSKGDCTPNSIVLSTYLHDCKEENGAICIASESDFDLIDHTGAYMSPDEQRFYRVECPEPNMSEVAESKFGEVVAFDFKRPHRSGINTSELIRLTFLLRVTSISELKKFLNEV